MEKTFNFVTLRVNVQAPTFMPENTAQHLSNELVRLIGEKTREIVKDLSQASGIELNCDVIN